MQNQPPHLNISIEELLKNKEAFNSFVYTPADEAVIELKKRMENKSINIPSDIPPFLSSGLNAVLSRHVTTSNYENIRFVNLADGLGLNPVFWEYNDDEFSANNKLKHALGKLQFYLNRHGGEVNTKNLTIINFNDSNGRKISEVKTIWGESIVELHHAMLLNRFPYLKENIFDASQWFYKNGDCSEKYYKSLLYPFIKNGILFENFLLDTEELPLTKDVILPAIIEIIKETGLKPLIVALEPTDIEGDRFWLCHPREDENFVLERIHV